MNKCLAKLFMYARGAWVLFGLMLLAALLAYKALDIYNDEIVGSVQSPDGTYIAEAFYSKQLFDNQTLIVLRRRDGIGSNRTVLTYETTQNIRIAMRWIDSDTLMLTIPCIPPNMTRSFFDDDAFGGWRRVIVNVSLADLGCRFARGAYLVRRGE